jgi:hypothetical protein
MALHVGSKDHVGEVSGTDQLGSTSAGLVTAGLEAWQPPGEAPMNTTLSATARLTVSVDGHNPDRLPLIRAVAWAGDADV